MEKEKKEISRKILIAIIVALIIMVIITFGVIIMNKSNNTSMNSSNNKSLTAEDIITVLEQDGRTEYLQKDSIKIGAIIDYDYDKYNQIACYSCIYKGNETLKYGCLMLINNHTGEYKNIVTDTYISALIFSQISSNNTNAQGEIMKLICNYFNEKGIDNFNYGNKDNYDRYVSLGKEIGEVIGVKVCRTLIDNAIHNDNTELEKFTFFYKPKEIFPCYAGCETTDKEYVWDKYGIAEYAINSLGKSTYNAMVYSYGYPYQYITKYTIMEYMGKDSNVVGEYSNKEKAKEKLVLEEAIDEPSTNTNNSSNTNSTVVADIQDRIDFFNSYYAWNFHPTDEQMQQMVEFANSTSNFTNDALADFITNKGWLPNSETGTVSSNNSNSNNNNGNSSSSNKNTSSSSSNTSNKNNSSSKTESEYFNVTVNINMKQIIQNNAIAKKVVDNVKEYPTIHISISDGAGDTGLIYQLENPADYSQGRKSIPDTITRNITTKAGAKIKFVIEMSSSSEENSSNNVAITLLEKEMTFDKTGTYEIK